MPGFSSQLSTPEEGSTCRTKRREVSGIFKSRLSAAPNGARAKTAAKAAQMMFLIMGAV